MTTTSVHFTAVKSNSESHNFDLGYRNNIKYVHHDRTSSNESWRLDNTLTIADYLQDIAERYTHATGQKMQAKATPIREAVVIIDKNTTLEQVQEMCNRWHEELGITTLQIAIHKDEGANLQSWLDSHPGEEPEPTKVENGIVWNYHAHIVCDFTDKQGKGLRIGKKGCSRLQDIASECLQMQRGERTFKKGLSAHQFRRKMMQQEEQELQRKIDLKYDELNNLIKTENALKTALHIGEQNGIDTSKLHKTEVVFKPEPISPQRYGKRSI